MKYCGTLISVSDMTRARNFYEQVMEQKVMLDLGVHVSFENAFSLQSNYEELVGVKLEAQRKPDNFQLYFEVDDLERWEAKLKSTEGIEFIHEIKEYPWGQRVFRFYDYDKFYLISGENSRPKELFGRLRDMEIIDRGNGEYECVPRGHSKATAIDLVLKHYGISLDDAYVFGDSGNDLAMFRYASNCILMGKHDEVLEPYATFETKEVEEDGIAYAMKELGII